MSVALFSDIPKDIRMLIFDQLRPIDAYSLMLCNKDTHKSVVSCIPDLGIKENIRYIMCTTARNKDLTDEFLDLFTENSDFALFGSLLVCAMSIPIGVKGVLPFDPKDADVLCKFKHVGTRYRTNRKGIRIPVDEPKRLIFHPKNRNGMSIWIRGVQGRGKVGKGSDVVSGICETCGPFDMVWVKGSFAHHLNISSAIEFTKMYWNGGIPHIKDIKSVQTLTSTFDKAGTKHVEKWARRKAVTLIYKPLW